MKALNITLILSSLLLLACHSKQERELLEIESWLDVNPDSALVIFEGKAQMKMERKRERALYALLYSQAKDKCYIEETDDSLIRVAYDYYSNHGPQDRSLRAWYYLGLVQRNAGEVASSIFSLLHAEQMAINQGNHHYAGLSERNIAELYYASYEMEKAEKYFALATTSFDTAGSSLYADYARLSWASCKSDLREFSFCDSLCSQVLKDNPDNENLKQKVFEIQSFSRMLRMPPEPELAISYYRKSRRASSQPEGSPQVCILSHAFELMGYRDSADYYLQQAMRYVQTAADSAMVLFEKSEVLSLRREDLAAKQCLEQSVAIQDSLLRMTLNQSVTSVLNEQISQENKNQRLLSERRLYVILWVLTLSLLIILMMTRVILHFIRQGRERNRQIHEKEESIKALAAQMEDYRRSLADLTQDIEEANRRNDRSAQSVSRQIAERVYLISTLLEEHHRIMRLGEKKMEYWERLDAMESQLNEYKDVMKHIQLDESFIEGLEQDINATHSDIVQRVRDKYSRILSETDFRLLVCLLAGLKPKNVAFLLSLPDGTLRTRKHRLYEKINQQAFSEEKEQLLSILESL